MTVRYIGSRLFLLLRFAFPAFVPPSVLITTFNQTELAVVWLAKTHNVAVIPGSSCGMKGHIRVAYANVDSATVC